MQSQPTIWPLGRDYNEAVQNPRNSFVDADLQDVVAAVDKFGMPTVSSGQFAYVFKLNKTTSNESLAVRCFRGFVGERDKRYKAIDDHLDRHKLPALARFEYESSGIRVNGGQYPVLVMEWIDGPTLDVYLDEVMGKREIILHLADQWIKLVKTLGEAQIAHGDLQQGNIIVQNGALRLVDFDGMYVPAMKGWNAIELGHQHFQHPMRDAFFFDARLDNFSALVIHLSFIALAEKPQLWAEYHDENLIFKKADFLKPSQSSLFQKVKAIGGECQRIGAILEKACTESVGLCPNLLDLASPKSKLPAWMVTPLGSVVQTKTREVSQSSGSTSSQVPIAVPAVSRQYQPNWQVPQPTVPAIAGVTPLSWRRVAGQGIGQAFGVFVISLFLFWLWVPVLGAIYTGLGGAETDAQTFAWISDIVICIGIGISRAKKQEAKRLKAWSHPIPPQQVSTQPATPTTYRVRPSRPYSVTPTPQSASGPIVGSLIRHIYHRPSCKWAGKISARNRIMFGSSSDAMARGYRRCRVCMP